MQKIRTAPEEKLAAVVQAAHFELVASAKAVKFGHEINPNFMIGGMLNVAPLYPASPKPADITLDVLCLIISRRDHISNDSAKATHSNME